MSYGTRSKSRAAAVPSTNSNPTTAAAPTTIGTKNAPAVKKGGIRKPTKSAPKKTTAARRTAGKKKQAAIADGLEDESSASETPATNDALVPLADEDATMEDVPIQPDTVMEDTPTELAADEPAPEEPAANEPAEDNTPPTINPFAHLAPNSHAATPEIKFPKRKLPKIKHRAQDYWPDASLPNSPIGLDDLDPDANLTVDAGALQERDELDYTAEFKTILAEEAKKAAKGYRKDSAEKLHAKELRMEAVWARYAAKLASLATVGNAELPALLSPSEIREYYAKEDARRADLTIKEATRRLQAEEDARRQEEEESGQRKDAEEATQQQAKGKGRAPEYDLEADNILKRKRGDFDYVVLDDYPSKRVRTGEPESRPSGSAPEASGSRKRKAPEPEDQDDKTTAARAQPTRQSKRIRRNNQANGTQGEASRSNAAAAAPSNEQTTTAPVAADPNEAIPPKERVLCGVGGCNNSANTVSELRKHYKVKHSGVAVPKNKEGLRLVEFVDWLNDRVPGYPPTEQAKKRYPSKIGGGSVPLPQAAPAPTVAGPSRVTDPTPAPPAPPTAPPASAPAAPPASPATAPTDPPSSSAAAAPPPTIPPAASRAKAPRERRPATSPIEEVLRRIEEEAQRRVHHVVKNGGRKNADHSLNHFMLNEENPAMIRRAMEESVGFAPPRPQGENLVDQQHLQQVQRLADEREDRIVELEEEKREREKEMEEMRRELGELKQKLGEGVGEGDEDGE